METFQRVQARLNSHVNRGQRRAAGPRYALRGLVLCAGCTVRVRGNTDPKRYHVSIVCPLCHRSRTYGQVEQRVQEALSRVPLPVAKIEGRRQAAADVVGQIEALTARIEKVRARRGRLINRREDGDITELDYLAAMGDSDRELAELTRKREEIVHGAQEAASVDETLRELSSIAHWSELVDPEQSTVEQRNRVYQLCFRQIVLDYAANTLTVTWSPALVRLAGRASETLAIYPERAAGEEELKPPVLPTVAELPAEAMELLADALADFVEDGTLPD
jgi:hypothetical protein